MTDKELYKLCCEYGAKALLWRRRFVALLPEVEKRRLYLKYDMYSVYEFAAKLGGISNNTVREVLRVYEKLKDMPKLLELIAEEGINKVRIVASIANSSTDKFWAEKVKSMTKAGLETYVKEYRKRNEKSHPGMTLENKVSADLSHSTGQNLLFGSPLNLSSVDNMSSDEIARPERKNLNIPISSKTEVRLRQFKKMLEKKQKRPVDWDKAINELMDSVENGKVTKSKTAKKEPRKVATRKTSKTYKSRTAPVAKKREAEEKYNGGCAFPGCNKPSTELHHPDRYAINKSHDRLTPLCDSHHELAHHGLIGNEEREPETWYIKEQPDKNTAKFKIDQKVIQYKMAFI